MTVRDVISVNIFIFRHQISQPKLKVIGNYLVIFGIRKERLFPENSIVLYLEGNKSLGWP